MYVNEIDEISKFLIWLHKINRPFGRVNYEQRFKEFKSGEKAPNTYFEVIVNFPGKAPKNLVLPEGMKLSSLTFSDHQHVKRISADHTNKLQIAARLCSNLDDPNWIKIKGLDGSYEKKYNVAKMKQFVKDNQKEINEIRLAGYDSLPMEFM